MNAHRGEAAISGIAAAIGEPARVRMLYSLLDGHARTSTELAVVGEVSPSTASVHLNRLRRERLIKVVQQGKHRYYSLEGPEVANALEALDVIAGGSRARFVPSTPDRLLQARTCYDHMAGKVSVLLHGRFRSMGWIAGDTQDHRQDYDLTPQGTRAFESLGLDLAAARNSRRRFAYACLDWSERQPHLAGALGAAVLQLILKKEWALQDLDSRALSVTRLGRLELKERFGIQA
ncbi:MAG TPA: helix-turn-helix domain-containing protein [Terriglobales bacterium]|nr:helix-turn-helix domain-containing protein [Terriglobales bacterium]